MALIQRVLTLHAATTVDVQLALLDAIEQVLLDCGASRVWIDPDVKPDLTIVAEFAER